LPKKVTLLIVAPALVQKPPPWPTALLLESVLSFSVKVALLAEPVAEPYQMPPPVPDESLLAALVTTLPSKVVPTIWIDSFGYRPANARRRDYSWCYC
jgi:hypothetical protein